MSAAARWIALWVVLLALYCAVDLPLRALEGEPWPPGRESLLGIALIPLVQLGALWLVQWMRRRVRGA